jgi:hypothetical protein
VCAAVVCVAAVLGACSNDLDQVQSGSTTTTPTTSTLPPTTTSTVPPTTSTTLPPTTTTNPIVTKGGVVKVANCSGVNGAAGGLTTEFAALGFETRDATNGAGLYEDCKVSVVMVVPGSEAVAKSVSRLMGGIEVLPMTTPAWISGANENLADATVLVMLGHDLAGKRLAEMAG